MRYKMTNLINHGSHDIHGNFVTDDYVFFWGGPFSNHYSCNVTFAIGGVNYELSCTEQAMMLLKAYIFDDNVAFKSILQTSDPKIQKKLGRSVKNFSETVWAQCRERLAVDFLYAKFSQNQHLADILLNTGNKILVEASPFDAIWGIKMGIDKYPEILDPLNWQGSNLLGKCLMIVRTKLKNEQNMFDIVKRASRQVNDNRSYNDILNHMIQETGELATEIAIINGKSYKEAGSDGIVGEAVDIIACALDIILKTDPGISETELLSILHNKCNKWVLKSK